MKRYLIQGREGLDVVRFGQDRADAVALLGGDPAVFRRPDGPKDYFYLWGLTLSYDDRQRVRFISVELGPEVLYRGVRLLGPSYEDVHRDLTALGLRGDESEAGIAFNALGFAVLGAPDDPEVHTWGVEVFPRAPRSTSRTTEPRPPRLPVTAVTRLDLGPAADRRRGPAAVESG